MDIVSFTIDSTEGSHGLCETYNGATLDHAGWLAFVQAARLDGMSSAKVRLVIAKGDDSLTFDVEISDRFTSIQNEIADRARYAEGDDRRGFAQLRAGYAWALDLMAAV